MLKIWNSLFVTTNPAEMLKTREAIMQCINKKINIINDKKSELAKWKQTYEKQKQKRITTINLTFNRYSIQIIKIQLDKIRQKRSLKLHPK